MLAHWQHAADECVGRSQLPWSDARRRSPRAAVRTAPGGRRHAGDGRLRAGRATPQGTPARPGVRSCMLTSADLQRDISRCRRLGVPVLPDEAGQAVGTAGRLLDSPRPPRPTRAGVRRSDRVPDSAAAHPAGRGQRGQPTLAIRLLEKQGHHRRRGRQRPGGAGRPGAADLRPRAHGRADAGNGRLGGDGRDPPPGERNGRPRPYHRHDRLTP